MWGFTSRYLHVRRLLRRGGLLHLEVQMRHDVLDLVLGVSALLDTVEMKQAAESRSIWGESPVVSQAQLTPGSLGYCATYQSELIWGFGPTAHGKVPMSSSTPTGEGDERVAEQG